MNFIRFLLPAFLCLAVLPAWTESATDIVTEAYEDVLGRKPDTEGMRNFRSKVIEKDWTAEDVRNALRDSDEYADKVIREAFQDVLGRKPDQGAYDTYRHKIRKKGWTDKDLRKELRKSEEYKQKNR